MEDKIIIENMEKKNERFIDRASFSQSDIQSKINPLIKHLKLMLEHKEIDTNHKNKIQKQLKKILSITENLEKFLLKMRDYENERPN